MFYLIFMLILYKLYFCNLISSFNKSFFNLVKFNLLSTFELCLILSIIGIKITLIDIANILMNETQSCSN